MRHLNASVERIVEQPSVEESPLSASSKPFVMLNVRPSESFFSKIVLA